MTLFAGSAAAQQPHQAPPEAKAAFDRGVALRTAKDLQGALTALSYAIQVDPDYSEAWRYRGLTYNDLGRFTEAMAEVNQAIKVDPRNAKAYYSRGYLKYGQKDYAGAIADSTLAIERDPQYSNAYMNRGIYKLRLGDIPGAGADVERALQIDPRNLDAVFNLGAIRMEAKAYVSARELFERWLALNPADARAGQARQFLAQIAAATTTPAAAPSPSPAKDTVPAPPASGGVPVAPPAAPQSSGPPAGDEAEPIFSAAEVVRIPMPTNVLDRATWPSGDVLWAASKSPPLTVTAKGQPIRVPGHLEFNKMSPAVYASAVSTAKEAMRLVQGPLSPDAERAFDAKWAPYFDYPSSEVVDYFNKLNPLLARLLDARAGFNTAVQALQKELAAAGAAASEKDRQTAATAMSAAGAHKAAMDGYQRTMADVAAAIAALGPVPNPFEVRARHAKTFFDAVEAARAPEPLAPRGSQYWVLSNVRVEKMPFGGEQEVYTLSSVEGLMSGSVRVRDGGGRAGSVKWSIPPRLIRVDGDNLSGAFQASLSAECGQVKPSELATMLLEGCASVSIELPAITSIRLLIAEANAAKPSGAVSGKFAVQPMGGDTLAFYVQGVTPGGGATYHYEYELKTLTPAQAAALQASADRAGATASGKPDAAGASNPGAQAAAAAQSAADRSRREAIAFQKDMSAYFEQQRARAAADLARATDPAVKKELTVQLLAYDANRAAAVDNAAYLDTGQWQRTRTLYDAYNLTIMDRNTREEAARAREPEAIANSTMRQVDLMPPELRAQVRVTWDAQVTGAVIMNRDTATMRRAAAQVAQQVRAYWGGVSGKEGDKADVMNVLTIGAQATEVVAGIALIGVAGAAAAGAGLTGAALWTAETLTGAAYGGATGYVEGGPEEATKRQLQWAGLLGYAASEALDAWGKGGDTGDVLKAGATSLLIGKAAEIGVKWAAGGVKWAAGKWLTSGPTGREAAEVAEFGRGLAAGKQAVARAEKAEWDLAQALSKGAKQAEVDRLAREAERHAAALNADWYAKFQLKLKGPSIAGQAFDKRIGQVYDAVIPDFVKELQRRGYDVSKLQFKPMRNPSSAGTVSMDLDLALVEAPGLVIVKNGTPVSRPRFQLDAQAVWNKVYQARTSQSATRSLTNITNSVHQEAFTLKLLEKRVPWGTLTPAEIAQAADVLRVKVSDIPLTGMTKFVENARGLEKEMRTKVLPYMAEQAAQAAKRGETAKAQSMRESQKVLQGIYEQFLEIGKHEHAPLEIWQLQQKLKQSTGGKSMWEIADALGVAWEASAKVK
ncbi:MAG: tetratricopeptide repeat protein [Acidobacteriota bacterium]